MKYYLGDKFLFIDMHQHYTHCVVEGDRLICCQKSQAEADKVCRDIVAERHIRLNAMKELLNRGHVYTASTVGTFGVDIKTLYPTAGLLAAGVRRMEKTIWSIRVLPLRAEP